MLTLKGFLPERKQTRTRGYLASSLKETDFMIGQSNQDEQSESRDNVNCRGTSSNSIKNPTQINHPQVDVHTLQENIVSKVRSEVDIVMTSVETRVKDAVLTAMENLVILRVELAMESANAL